MNKNIRRQITAIILSLFAAKLFAGSLTELATEAEQNNSKNGENPMLESDQNRIVSGEFEVKLDPQNDSSFPAGRMLIDKTYLGEISGVGIGQMISKRVENGAAVYFAIEEFNGSIEGAEGSFTLIHKGFMSAEKQSLEVDILEGSGTADLENISGKLAITQKDGKHYYELSYNL